MPPTKNVEEKVKEIMEPFYEGEEENTEPFYDFYVIGGRYSGEKLTQTLDKKKVDKFFKELKKQKITVSGFQAGKQEISPAEQIPLVDKIWDDLFPEIGGACPFFKHYNNQYQNKVSYPDIMKVKDIPEKLKCNKVIVATLNYDETKFKANTMIDDSCWNGVSWNDTKWDKEVKSVIKKHNDSFKNANKDYAKKRIVKDNWIAVTVDYHN